jgi:hypothetical protein
MSLRYHENYFALGWRQAPHLAAMSYLALSTSASFGASDQITFVWCGNQNKRAGSVRHRTYQRRSSHVCNLMWDDLGWWQAPHLAAMSYLALSTSASFGTLLLMFFLKEREIILFFAFILFLFITVVSKLRRSGAVVFFELNGVRGPRLNFASCLLLLFQTST